MAENVSSTDLLNFAQPPGLEDSGPGDVSPKPKRKYTPRKKREAGPGPEHEEKEAIQLTDEQIAQMQTLVSSGIAFIWRGATKLLAKVTKEPRWESDESEANELAPYFKATLDVLSPALFRSPWAPTILALTGYVGRRIDIFVSAPNATLPN